ncbi:MAG: 50S ribosomal protein L19 [uncultured bacterium (gcode 4)]|uniref:50S ribosomal protein L19 n=1 Tax=uncultured bacterium (gcode 4) TaxID=1234023 RepID=K2GCY7_9BACT|nr:MAG: 50S ribosomal protein L19 [uncultured bacterium (gcode 4)]EKE29751.1 MAG: 50S ribosomal protein L19 [uncultured bacterium (gcode 4)]
MNTELINEIQKEFLKADAPVIRTGMEVEVETIIKEWSKERTQKFKGLVIKTAGKTPLEKCITVRKTTDGFAIEKIFPIHSPGVGKITILRQFKVRRSNIAFIKKLSGKAARLKEVK